MFKTILAYVFLGVCLPLAGQIRIACGLPAGSASVTDSAGNVWTSDAALASGGPSYSYRINPGPSNPIYQNLRYGTLPFTLKIPVPAGVYNLTLKFIDPIVTVPGGRLFTVTANGSPVLYNFDLVATAGAGMTPYDVTVPISVSGSSLVLTFTTLIRDALISAIDIEPTIAIPPQALGAGLIPTAINGLPGMALDTGYALSRATDQAATDHLLLATSSPQPGLTYTANTVPALAAYTTGSFWIFFPDVTNIANATLNIQGLGPVALEKVSNGALVPVTGGECIAGTACFLVSVASSVSAAAWGGAPASPVDGFAVYSPAAPPVYTEEVPSGALNGSNAVFTLANTPAPGWKITVERNGLALHVLAGDYTISGRTITFPSSEIPQAGDTLIATYYH